MARTFIIWLKYIVRIVLSYFKYLRIRNSSLLNRNKIMAKETKELGIALAKVSASIAISLKDGKFNLKDDAENFMDDIVPILQGISDIDEIKNELPLDDAARDEVVSAAVAVLVADLGIDPTSEKALAAADVATGVLGLISLITDRKEVTA